MFVLENIKNAFTVISTFLILTNVFPMSSGGTLLKQSYLSSLNNNSQPPSGIKNKYEVFGFAPYWNLSKMDNVNFDILTTMAYFDLPVNQDGSVDPYNAGYQDLNGDDAKALFQKARAHGTKIVLTFTQMDDGLIESFLDNQSAVLKAQREMVKLVKDNGLNGLNIDFEYIGDPGDDYRNKFTAFIKNLTLRIHGEIPGSQVSVSVLAASMKDGHLYDIQNLASACDRIFMMAYDFATSSSDAAVPTSPLYGYKQGQYWYDVSTAVTDFLAVMPSEKLILGLPWYGYDYPVSNPGIKVSTDMGYYYSYWYRWRKYWAFARYPSKTQTYAAVMNEIQPDKTGWDDVGKVNWKAYIDENGIWRMIFLEDEKSLRIKYDFAKSKKLAGVGMWALGFDDGHTELWDLLVREFGQTIAGRNMNQKLADNI